MCQGVAEAEVNVERLEKVWLRDRPDRQSRGAKRETRGKRCERWQRRHVAKIKRSDYVGQRVSLRQREAQRRRQRGETAADSKRERIERRRQAKVQQVVKERLGGANANSLQPKWFVGDRGERARGHHTHHKRAAKLRARHTGTGGC